VYSKCCLVCAQISVTVAQRHGESDVPMLKLVVDSIGVKLRARDFDTSVNAYLGGVYVQHMLFKGPSAVILRKHFVLHAPTSVLLCFADPCHSLSIASDVGGTVCTASRINFIQKYWYHSFECWYQHLSVDITNLLISAVWISIADINYLKSWYQQFEIKNMEHWWYQHFELVTSPIQMSISTIWIVDINNNIT